jgi:hypothetical protein
MTMRETANRSGKLLGIDFSVAMGLAAALVFFMVSGLVTYVNFQGLRVANQRIVETHRAIVSRACCPSFRTRKPDSAAIC